MERKVWVFGWGMYHVGDGFPTIARDPDRVIHGEVWSIPQPVLDDIDVFEGDLYTKGFIELPYGDRCITYYYEYNMAVGLRPVERGFWPPPSN